MGETRFYWPTLPVSAWEGCNMLQDPLLGYLKRQPMSTSFIRVFVSGQSRLLDRANEVPT